MKVDYRTLILAAAFSGFLAYLIGDFSSKQPDERKLKVSEGIARVDTNTGKKSFEKGSKTIVVNGVEFICKDTGPINARSCLDDEAISAISGKYVRAYWYSRDGLFLVSGRAQLVRMEDKTGRVFVVEERFVHRRPDFSGAALILILAGVFGIDYSLRKFSRKK